ncbi:TPA: undecaprenyl-phosphate 4-deoxy-4-formamido-L-arabinose transferase [Aeromonas salmonicida]|uniref:Undecaprenyl-phosphate 4-deoxy-4-formamido-L-arabinose transferase n=2 Tax=Gammaproteobacteria TaxID=1236 RepID=A0A3L0VYN1_ECOLX|nr:undecaprenyl-phosphate 4-deoxy-4-formamido-L-arabinose transferase [Aeromonas salmonicida]MBP6383847.1 undecaprenyl-phosphate 4-deoxy-4-formamido-L-arabinose transferase [Aeromonas sp.]ASI22527.1 undecaprenyl-phosphate 4-deoxy-4-formamido-L-arabinose transferase [Aeromonas salmonicida]ASI26842.1 undecaprenyl-phosphate 4-deoxy-4-formamido-L-arabinose transferase [Aeromonas salmonicida]ASI30960.1 undecaprenyl-phosphate 4-deoxy-4-formamido-L-arabinose transferase [Aeromonas salmonicida]ATD3822
MNNTDIKLVSVIIPVYNEEASLPVLLSRVTAACELLPQDYEVILIDDGSHDGSTEIISEAAANSDSKLVGVLLNRNYGQHAAIMAGFETAKGDLVITLDADLQNPPEEIPRLVEAAMQGYDVVGTVRRNRQDSWFRKTASRLINKSVQKATGVHMSDYGCMLRAYRRHIIDAMLCCQERSTFIPILANSFARRTIELEVGHAERAHGESKYGLMHLINLMYDLVTCMTTTPLRLLSIVGSLVAGLGFTFSILLVLMRLVMGADWAADGVFTLFAILFTFVGVQLLGMGLLGEYIGRMYTDVRARPRYFIHQIVRTATPSQQETEQ